MHPRTRVGGGAQRESTADGEAEAVLERMGGAGVERKARNGVPPEGIPPSGMIAPAAASPPNVAVMGPKDGTMTAKNALNAVMGPKNGTMAALHSRATSAPYL